MAQPLWIRNNPALSAFDRPRIDPGRELLIGLWAATFGPTWPMAAATFRAL